MIVAAFFAGILCERTSILSNVEEAAKSIARPLYVGSWPEEFEEVEITSSVDGTIQKAMVYRAVVQEPAPLLISLHTWAGSYKTLDPIAKLAQQSNWNYIHPDFRGPNNRPEACLGKNVVSDIDDSIEFGLKNLGADVDQIMIVGMSGGGHAALGHLATSTGQQVRTYAAWCSVTDIEAWYNQLTARGYEFDSLVQCCHGSDQLFDKQIARERSPVFMAFDQQRLRKSNLLIRAGMLDGIIGKVPFEHSVNFFDRCCRELNRDASQISESERISIYRAASMPHPKHAIVFEKSAENIHLSLFFGGHEFLPERAMRELSEALTNVP